MNKLSQESSLYLQQHADNPVHWYAWGEEALAAAKAQDKPILLSVGYSACHWCHVMAHESFENDATAKVMNELFINIKVDREERPDIDKIYQTAHQLMAQRPGGWPLTMFLSPDDQLPFFGGTYFPPEARYGMPAFTDIMQRVHQYFREQRDDVKQQGEAIRSVFPQLEPAQDAAASLDDAPIKRVREQLEESFDADNGGFGSAPKFPQIPCLVRLLNHWRASASSSEPDMQALLMSALSQTRMARGGLFDQIGGGFFRYCVDANWVVPHFEKMLYDNGQLLSLYAATWQATGDSLFADATRATADWLLTDMRHADGGFFATLDADSQGEEGIYYVFAQQEAQTLLGDDYPLAAAHFGFDKAPNFEGKYHLVLQQDVAELTQSQQSTAADVNSALARIRQTLLTARKQRVAPGRDEKILTAWNALAIKGLAHAARALDDPSLQVAAEQAADFIQANLWQEGRLLASFQGGKARFNAYLDDYAFLLDALIELTQNNYRADNIKWACELADVLLEHFQDEQHGGFFFTAHDHEKLMHRPKPISDDATPSGNAIAARALIRLGHLLGEQRYVQAGENTIKYALSAINEYPQAHVSMIEALVDALEPPQIIVLRGDPTTINDWRTRVQALYSPTRLVVAIDANETALPGALALRTATDAKATAYLCEGTQCSLPISEWEALAARIREMPTSVANR